MSKDTELDLFSLEIDGEQAPLTDGNAGSFQEQAQNNQTASSLAQQATNDGAKAHPKAQFFHILFKAMAIIVYLMNTFFTQRFVLVFVICILLLAFDFWTVKNVTGRLLVGLRWWNNIRDDGTSEWIFESHDNSRPLNAADSKVFWVGLYVTPVIWFLFFLTALLSLRFGWMLIVVVALSLNSANVVGYWKCQKDARSKLRSMLAQGIASGLSRV
eukprot:TRINITY_DN3342_c0_g1_i1.p1 TRINITY_DN3342_c0_g1~~TRINITY_DN3342_c0_g1_i1.p1  ORF type:complete len:215 (+),score=25.50 TRINITY_DN3342_c0_g1_i1:410-1054(+)